MPQRSVLEQTVAAEAKSIPIELRKEDSSFSFQSLLRRTTQIAAMALPFIGYKTAEAQVGGQMQAHQTSWEQFVNFMNSNPHPLNSTEITVLMLTTVAISVGMIKLDEHLKRD
ncbi:MAG: hypothetical protein KGH60_03295 [Candidatus Micrarchaeota archaeon]|nr:hypothetical protein [Candidatus Micrarchaeota archaeon]